MPASKRDLELAKALLGSEDDITTYIVRLEVSVDNTTKSEIDAMCKGRRASDDLQGKGKERQADRHEVQPEYSIVKKFLRKISW